MNRPRWTLELTRATRSRGCAQYVLAMFLSLLAACIASHAYASPPAVLIVVGAPGEEQYGQQFDEWAERWQSISQGAGADVTRIGNSNRSSAEDPANSEPTDRPSSDAEPSDRDRLIEYLKHQAQPVEGEDTAPEGAAPSDQAITDTPLWIVLIGHGTFDGRTARFNLVGPDFSADELAEWIKPIRRPLILLNSTAASAPFLPLISGPNRVVVTATQSGDEQQFTRLGGMLAEALGDARADLDKDQQTSLLEAAIYGSRLVARFYSEQGRLATEHALLDDNGDQKGTPLSWFEGVMATAKVEGDHALDGNLAHQWHLVATGAEQRLTPEQLAQRAQLEQQLIDLRRTRPQVVDIDAYYARMEPILLELARLYRDAEAEQ